MIIFVISHRDSSDEGSQHMLYMQNSQKLSLIITKYALLLRALKMFLIQTVFHKNVAELRSDQTISVKNSSLIRI